MKFFDSKSRAQTFKMTHVFLISIFIHRYFVPKASKHGSPCNPWTTHKIIQTHSYKQYDRCMIKNSSRLSRSLTGLLVCLLQDKLILWTTCISISAYQQQQRLHHCHLQIPEKSISPCDTISHTHEQVESKVKLWLKYRLSASLAHFIWGHKIFHKNE